MDGLSRRAKPRISARDRGLTEAEVRCGSRGYGVEKNGTSADYRTSATANAGRVMPAAHHADRSVSVGKLWRCKPQHNLCRTLTWNALSNLHDSTKPREGVDLPAPFGRIA